MLNHKLTLIPCIGAEKAVAEGEAPAAEGEQPEEGAENMEEDELDDNEEGNEKKYVKKEYIARPYNSEFVEKTAEEVEALSIKNAR